MRLVTLSLLVVVGLSSAALAAGPLEENNGHAYAPVPVGPSAAPADVGGVLYARQFTLETPLTYTWRADQPAIRSGWLLVVAVKPELAAQRNTFNPVLYVGRYPVQIEGADAGAGRLVVIVPASVDLARDPIYFGSVELPGEVTPERAQQEMQAAVAAGFKPMTPEALRLAQQVGGETLTVRDFADLRAGAIADAIDAYAPADSGTAAGYRAPRVSAGTR